MSESPPDEVALLEDLLEGLPDTGSDRELRLIQAIRYLAEFTGKSERPLPPGIEAIALRLTRDALFDLYAGFRLGTFRGISSIPRPPGEPSAAQIRLGERLKALLRIEAARAEMFRWFLTGLRHQVGRLLGESLPTAPPIWEPRRLFVHWRGRLALALAETFRAPNDKENPDHEFGLYGLHLLFSGSGAIRPQEFQALCDLMSWWAEYYPYFPELEIRDLVRTIAQASLSPEQIGELVRRLHAWHDLERYPAERSFASYREFVRANAQAAGYGKAFTALAMLLAPLFRPRSLPLLGEEYQRYREQVNRRWGLAPALASLALQDEGCIPALAQEIDALLEMKAPEAEWVLVKAVPAFLNRPSHLYRLQSILDRHHFQKFDDLKIGDLQNLRLEISSEALETLLDLMHRFPDARWPLQILENAGKLSPTAEEWLSRQVPDTDDEILVTAALALHQRLSLLRETPLFLLESALRQRLEQSLKENAPIPDSLVRWVLGLPNEALRRLLSSLAKGVESGFLQIAFSLSDFLRTIANEVSHADRPDAVKLAACWLIDPDDGLHSGLTLAERLAQAARMVQRNRFDETVAAWLARIIPTGDSFPPSLKNADDQIPPPIERALSVSPRLAAVLDEPIGHRQEYPMRAGASRRLALARALGQVRSPEIALPLLANLFHLAVEMFLAWSRAGGMPRYFPELFWEANALALEVLKAVTQLEPVLPQAVALLEEILLARYRMPEGGFTPGVIVRDRQISSEAISALVALLQREYPPEEKHCQRIWQCALQWLSNVSTLDAEQQEVIWNVGYASPLILTRSLALLVLGRQRPLNARAWETVLSLLRTPWHQLYQERAAEIRRLNDREAWSILGPGDVFLIAGVAVALTAEWSAEIGLLSNEQRQELHQAWQHAASDLNLTLEGKLAESTHPMLSAEWSNARGLALSMCNAVGYDPDDDPDWLVRPADLARRLLPASISLQREEVGVQSIHPRRHSLRPISPIPTEEVTR
jgi:hypothetical protein